MLPDKARSALSMGVASPWKRRSRTTVYQNDWIELNHDDVVRPDGKDGVYGVVHFRSRSVGVVAIDRDDRVLLVGQYRYAVERYSWEIPAGGAPTGESTLEAARRELKKETGYYTGTLKLVLQAYLSNSVTDEEAYLYRASDLVAGASNLEGTERIQSRWMPLGDALREIRNGGITDAMTILGLQHVAIERLGLTL